ncbi:hypothetical protein HK101_006408 [Irineochytrium annulatum]|nr:hypothetical protein HK101_006408 [Irineochytrium annulatum]
MSSNNPWLKIADGTPNPLTALTHSKKREQPVVPSTCSAPLKRKRETEPQGSARGEGTKRVDVNKSDSRLTTATGDQRLQSGPSGNISRYFSLAPVAGNGIKEESVPMDDPPWFLSMFSRVLDLLLARRTEEVVSDLVELFTSKEARTDRHRRFNDIKSNLNDQFYDVRIRGFTKYRMDYPVVVALAAILNINPARIVKIWTTKASLNKARLLDKPLETSTHREACKAIKAKAWATPHLDNGHLLGSLMNCLDYYLSARYSGMSWEKLTSRMKGYAYEHGALRDFISETIKECGDSNDFQKNCIILRPTKEGIGKICSRDTICYGGFVGEVVGEICSKRSLQRRRSLCPSKVSRDLWFLHHQEDIDIAYAYIVPKPSVMLIISQDRYHNHSCEPNLRGVFYVTDWKDRPRLALFAKFKIAPGDELTVDYREYHRYAQDCHSDGECVCGRSSRKSSGAQSKRRRETL